MWLCPFRNTRGGLQTDHGQNDLPRATWASAHADGERRFAPAMRTMIGNVRSLLPLPPERRPTRESVSRRVATNWRLSRSALPCTYEYSGPNRHCAAVRVGCLFWFLQDWDSSSLGWVQQCSALVLSYIPTVHILFSGTICDSIVGLLARGTQK